MSRHKQLILTFDAFGTLFTPREAIGKQYADAARRHGLFGFTNDQIASSFRAAFKSETDRFPNYGKTVGMSPSQWWANIIHATFRPFNSDHRLPDRLVPELLTRFSSAAGYMLYIDVLPFFRSLRQLKAASHVDSAWSEPIIGIITNSDDRVPSILSSLGLQVGLWRHGTNPQVCSKEEDDINFVVMSYDVGSEKPDSKIFDTTKQMMPGRERYLHVGDDLQKDYHAAKRAGWDGILLDREVKTRQENSGPITRITSLPELIPYIS